MTSEKKFYDTANKIFVIHSERSQGQQHQQQQQRQLRLLQQQQQPQQQQQLSQLQLSRCNERRQDVEQLSMPL
jgi:hypothetical protein